MICFDSDDIKLLFEVPKKQRIAEEINKRGYTSEELRMDMDKMMEIVNAVAKLEDKEEIEIFSAVYSYFNFYPGSKVCFLLKDGFDPNKEKIDTLEKLKSALKESDLTDFGFMSEDGFRAFQLKAYKGITAVDPFFDYVKKVLLHYGNDLGEVNLLFTMQSKGDFPENFFQELHDRLKAINVKGGGKILVSYNEDNKFDVINTVYPTLGRTRLAHKKFSE